VDEIVERAQRFFERSQRIESMDLVEIDVIGGEARKASLNLIHDVQTREADLVRAVAHSAVYFAGDDHVAALRSQRFRKLGLRFAA
jgi:hypothetical protein